MKEIFAMGLQPRQVRKSLTIPPSPRQQEKISQDRQSPHIMFMQANQNLVIGSSEGISRAGL